MSQPRLGDGYLQALSEAFVAAGLGSAVADAKAPLAARALGTLGSRGGRASMWWVPGRIEFLGKHTDYAGGPSLVCAIERGFVVASTPRSDRRVRVADSRTGERIETELSAELAPRAGAWSNYPLTVVRRVVRNFPGALTGVDLAFASDLPSAAGLSSSSALIVATFIALAEANDLPARAEYHDAIHNHEDLAAYLGAVENGSSFRALAGDYGVGTQGGSQDHTAILCARGDALVQYSYAPVRFERQVALPDRHLFIVATSGVVAEKTGSALSLYNQASARAAGALRAWREATGSSAPTLAAALGEAPNALEGLTEILGDRSDLVDRVKQFANESRIVCAAGDALARNDLAETGLLVDISQAAAEHLLGNQIPETIYLARSARELGAAAASAFGAGFGGSVYALVPASSADDFRRRWAERYAETFPHRAAGATFFASRAGPSLRAFTPSVIDASAGDRITAEERATPR